MMKMPCLEAEQLLGRPWCPPLTSSCFPDPLVFKAEEVRPRVFSVSLENQATNLPCHMTNGGVSLIHSLNIHWGAPLTALGSLYTSSPRHCLRKMALVPYFMQHKFHEKSWKYMKDMYTCLCTVLNFYCWENSLWGKFLRLGELFCDILQLEDAFAQDRP